MVSRRSLLQASGAALAAGGLGIGLPNPAGAAESAAARPLLPSFGRPTHLDIADVSTLDGHDQLLLTTLQSVVNRCRPRLYLAPRARATPMPVPGPRRRSTRTRHSAGRFLRRTGLDLVYAYNPRNAAGDGVPFDERVVRSYRDHTQLRGIIQSWETGDLRIRPAGLPVIGNFFPQGKAAEYRDGLLKHIKDWDGGSPLFIAGAVNAWSWTPGDVAELGELLGDPFEIVRGDVFFDLLNRAGSREG
jgi:hypothetical protein